MMDIGTRAIFSPEQDMFRESVRKFMQTELGPQQVEFHGHKSDLLVEGEEDWYLFRPLLKRRDSRLGSRGWPWGRRSVHGGVRAEQVQL
jgi:hypothetical protein